MTISGVAPVTAQVYRVDSEAMGNLSWPSAPVAWRGRGNSRSSPLWIACW